MMKQNLFLLLLLGWSSFLWISCGPDPRVRQAEQLMARRQTDSAVAVMEAIGQPVRSLSERDYALYALLRAEAAHRQGQLTAATDTLLLPAIRYFSRSGDSACAERALYCKAHLERRLYRGKEAVESFLRALSFLQGSRDYEQLYRVNTWLGVVCLGQEDYRGKLTYSKAALQAALALGNDFYKNMALCDISTGYYYLQQPDSALHYARMAFEAARADSLPRQFSHIYTNLGVAWQQKGDYARALDCIDRSIALRPAADSLALCGLYATKVELWGALGRYDSARACFRRALACASPATQADACRAMAEVCRRAGRPAEAYGWLQRFVELADTVRLHRQTAETLALQEVYRHEQQSLETQFWRRRAAEQANGFYLAVALAALCFGGVMGVWCLYLRNRRRLLRQSLQLDARQHELDEERARTWENRLRLAELERKEARMKETFFRRLSAHIVQRLGQGDNVVLTDSDWDDVLKNADAVFEGFVGRLQVRYPLLNKEDVRYCCMVKMQLTQAEMAQVMHVEKDSVKKRLRRIRTEKMGAGGGQTLEGLLQEV